MYLFIYLFLAVALFKFFPNSQLWWPAPWGLFLCKWEYSVCSAQIHGNKIMQMKTREKHHSLYGSPAPECSVNYLWKCWQKRSRFNKARFSGGATPANSQVELGLYCSLWILMMVHWSRYANIHCSVFPVSAEKSGCVKICNICRMTTPPFFLFLPHPICTLWRPLCLPALNVQPAHL